MTAAEASLAIVEFDALDGLVSEVIGSPVSPHAFPDMSIFDTIYWVAREGGAKDFHVNDRPVWESAITVVVSKLRSGEIPFLGRSADGLPDVVPAHKLSGVRIDHPFQPDTDTADLAWYDGPRLDLGPKGDRLVAGEKPDEGEAVLDLCISSDDVIRFWSFGALPSRSGEHDDWLQKILARLSVCQEVRVAIGWDEISELIDQSWLKSKGFGPSTPVDIGALRGKLISEALPRTSGPPKSSLIPIGVDGLFEVPAHGHYDEAQPETTSDALSFALNEIAEILSERNQPDETLHEKGLMQVVNLIADHPRLKTLGADALRQRVKRYGFSRGIKFKRSK